MRASFDSCPASYVNRSCNSRRFVDRLDHLNAAASLASAAARFRVGRECADEVEEDLAMRRNVGHDGRGRVFRNVLFRLFQLPYLPYSIALDHRRSLRAEDLAPARPPRTPPRRRAQE